MNELKKFRAWDKIDKEMFTPILLSFPFGENRIIVSGRGGSTDTKNDDCILMQFTGLLDKNGKEIFEGDINANDNNRKSEVVFYSGGFYLKYSRTEYKAIGSFAPFDLNIIGNLYENPELLK